MTSITTNAASLNPVQGLLADLRSAFADWALYRRTLSELRSLSARDLTDLGISRFALADIARDSVYGK